MNDSTALVTAGAVRTGAASGPVVVEARGLEKTFRIPDQRVDSLKERVAHPFRQSEYRTLRAVQDVSFDVHQGEFFGIVGRNGSGKSTLLKILASIYRPDSGRVRMAGRVAPFIELGVGFNPDLTSRENCLLNGVLMGLTRSEAQYRLDAVLDFAELRDFADLKLKNYSSGMTVRLAFAIMVQADADVMLIDEVLAVGDAAFGQKCMDVFYEKRRAGKTIVLVTHDMATVQSLCHRAMLMHDGELQFIGDPEDTAMRYYRLNFGGAVEEGGEDASAPSDETNAFYDLNGRVVHAHLRDPAGKLVDNVEQDVPIGLDVVLEAARELVEPIFVFHIINEDGLVVAGFTRSYDGTLAPGGRVKLAGAIENPLVPGRYSVDVWIRRDSEGSDMALQPIRLLYFVVYGTAPRHGIVTVRSDVEATAVLEPAQ
ncbi:MAG: type transport system ATP-binding protein [Solirubrobacteraceae bacterium]|nr:type transport system ATP-binding protein [Solirubrobacteraceae bacterium]